MNFKQHCIFTDFSIFNNILQYIIQLHTMSFYMCHSTDKLSDSLHCTPTEKPSVYNTTYDTVKVIGTPKNISIGQIDSFKIKTDVLSVNEDSFRFTSLKKLTLHYTELITCSKEECLYLPNVEELKLNFTHHDSLVKCHSVSECVLNFKLCAPKLKVLHMKREYIDIPLFDKSYDNLNYMLAHCNDLKTIKFHPHVEHVYDTIDFTFKLITMFDELIEYSDRCNTFATLYTYSSEGVTCWFSPHHTHTLERVKQIEEKAIKYGYISGVCPIALQNVGETEEQTFERLLNEYQTILENYEKTIHDEQNLDGFENTDTNDQNAMDRSQSVQTKIDTIRKNYKEKPEMCYICSCYAFYDSRFEALSDCLGRLNEKEM
jgi:hypothetical protein